MNFWSKFELLSFNRLVRNKSIAQILDDDQELLACNTAPATPGLLITMVNAKKK